MASEKIWHDDDSLWETLAPFMFTSDLLKDTLSEIDDVISLLEIQHRAEILDLGCGQGRHSLELARRGHKVTGLDRTATYIKEARRLAATESLTVEFVQDDMRSFVREDAFNYVVNLFTSGISYFEDIRDDKRIIDNVYKSLKPGGRFLIQTAGKEILARIFQKRDWVERDGAFYLQERNIEKNWSWINNRWIFIRDGRVKEYRIGHRLYGASELSALLADCGFAEVKVYGDLKGSPYDNTAKRLVVVATK